MKVTFLEEGTRPDRVEDSNVVARVPESAIYGDASQPYTYVLNDARVERRALELGEANRGSVSVLAGVEPGERVVIGATGLEDGMEVRTE